MEGLQSIKKPKKQKSVPPSLIIDFFGGGTSYSKKVLLN
jgi:hypothetical protein